MPNLPGFFEDDFDDSIFMNFFKNKKINNNKIIKDQKYYDTILNNIDIKYIENYMRRKKLQKLK